MICKDTVLTWFTSLSSHSRIDLMCSLLNKCLPFELRFLGTVLENLGRQDFNQMKDFEVKANNAAELTDFHTQSCIISDTRTRQKLAVYVCLLHSLNSACSTIIYKCLYGVDINEVAAKARSSDEKILDELLTIYTVAVNHPAFTFEQRSNLGSILLRLAKEEIRLQSEKLIESFNAEYNQSQVDGIEPCRNEMLPPGAPPSMGYPPGSFIPMYALPGQPNPFLWRVAISYPPMADMAPPMPAYGSPIMSRGSSPAQSTQHSRNNSPLRKPYPPKTRPLFSDPPPPLIERTDPPPKDSPIDTEVRNLNERLMGLSTEEMLRGAAVSLNGIVAPPGRGPPRVPYENEVHHPPFNPAVTPRMHPRFNQGGFNSHGFDDNRHSSSSSSGSDASSTTHSPPNTPASLHRNWDKGRDGDEYKGRVGMSRVRGRFGGHSQGVQTLPRERGPVGSGGRRDGNRSAPPTPHEENKTYSVPPPTGDSGPGRGDMIGAPMPFATPFLPGPYSTGPPVFTPFPPAPFMRPPYSYPNGEVLYTYQPAPATPYLPSAHVNYSSPPPKIACYNCSSQTHQPNDCKEPTMEEYCSKDDNMSSVDTSMSSSDVSEKGPIDFAVKAVSLKPTDSNRLLQTGGPLRTIPSSPISRQVQFAPPPGPNISSQKTVSFNRVVTATSTSGGMSSGATVTAKPGPPLSSAGPVSTNPAQLTTATYLLPRGQVSSGPRPSSAMSRATMTIQPVSSAVRTQGPVGPPNHLRGPSPAGIRVGTPRPAGKPVGPRTEQPRPMVMSNNPRPLTLTTASQFIPEKGLKMPVAQVVPIRPPFGSMQTFIGQNQTAILQRADMTLTSASPGTVLTTPVRLTPPLTPFIGTQRVAVSVATVGTRLTLPQQQLATTGTNTTMRAPVQGVSHRGTSPHQNQTSLPKMSIPTVPPPRIAYAAHSTGSRTTQGTVSLANSKPVSTVVTTGTRMVQANPRQPTPQSPAGLLLHPLVVSTTVRPGLVAAPGTKVIQHSIPSSIQLTSASKANTTSYNTPSSSSVSKSTEPYKIGSSLSLTRINPPAKTYPMGTVSSGLPPTLSIPDSDQPHLSTVFIPAQHRSNPSPGVITSQAPERHTYTLPGGASYFYEAPSGYQLATDAPLVARPLSPDAPLATRQLSSEGPLIARPFTPAVSGLIGANQQPLRYTPVMLVETGPAGGTVAPATTVESITTSTDPQSKLTASPRPSILRKRDSEGNINTKVVKNLTSALSGRSRSPTPPVTLQLETAPAAGPAGAEVGPSSNGSSTMSANSSPGPEENADPDKGVEMSPRKKPRKQLLNDANEPVDMEFITEDKSKKDKTATENSETTTKVCVLKKPTSASLLKAYKHSWKSRNNHFQRYTDVRVREERRPTVTELANQRLIHQRIKGWKVYHLSTQFENLSDMETSVLERLSTIFKSLDTNLGKECEKEVDRVNELIMGNIQRSKVIRDQMMETKTQMMKGFEHKVHVSELLSKNASKRNFKKRDRY